MNKPKLLIVDDDEEIRTQMKWALSQEYEISLAEDQSSALPLFRSEHPQVVLLDLGLPPAPADPTEGLALLSEMLQLERITKVIVISGQSEKDNALGAIGLGAYDFLCKPVEIDVLKVLLKRAFHVAALERELDQLQQSRLGDSFEGMLGTSPAMQQVFTFVRKVAGTDAPVLILGESGTGKEVTALAFHRRSRRHAGPFLAINCGAIPENLLESELFGHEKGAFTGAHMQRKGKLEAANGGTLFLDEIGELPLALQVKMLRFLQEQTFERVGGRTPIHMDARVIAATNTDLAKAMSEGKFREDLYYRLAVVVLKLPSLRERHDDVMLLAQAFARQFATEMNKRVPKFSKQANRAILQHRWPGNIRELQNCIKRAVIMCEGRQIVPEDLQFSGADPLTLARTLRDGREAVEREMVQDALRRHSGKISGAAADLGISRPTLYELMEKLGIKNAVRENHEPPETVE